MTRTKREAIKGSAPRRPRAAATIINTLDRATLQQDLDALKSALETRFAYEALGDRDWRREIEERKSTLPKTLDDHAHARWLDEFMNGFRDGHARVRGPSRPHVGGWPAFLLRDVEGGTVAFRPDRSALIDPARPFVTAIDGLPLATGVASTRT